jgi:hypothetical protein
MYAPKVLEGDTQPWMLLGALIALLTFRTQSFLRRDAVLAVALAALALLFVFGRSGLTAESLRSTYVLGTFAILFVVAKRGGHDLFAVGVRITLLIWFLVGAYQYVALLMNLPVNFVGRFVEGRSGVPSLTAEASYFGSLSVLMSMYLLHFGRRTDLPYHAMAVLSVLMSGSLLAAVLLLFPFLYLRNSWKLLAFAAVATLITLDAAINEAGLTARVAGFASIEEGALGVLLDPSLNLRLGHIYFTLWENLGRELLLRNPIDFMAEYNTFAQQSGVLIPTESNFVLPIAGELLYLSGPAGLAIALMIVFGAANGGSLAGTTLLRAAFALACLLNPISVANPLLIFFATQPKRCLPQ